MAGELRRACEEAAGTAVELGGSGRTDRGVHALAQVAHLRLPLPVDAERFRFAVNDALPADVNLLAVARAPDRFHARHDARARSYLYQIARRRTAFGKPFVWWVRRGLDPAAMARALAAFRGRHDFAAYCEPDASAGGGRAGTGRGKRAASTVVVVERAELAEAGALLLVRLVASHFLWRMVRRVVGTLVGIGGGEVAPAEALALLADPRAPVALRPAERTAPPAGLFLERVLYPGDPHLAPPRPVIEILQGGAPPPGAMRASSTRLRKDGGSSAG